MPSFSILISCNFPSFSFSPKPLNPPTPLQFSKFPSHSLPNTLPNSKTLFLPRKLPQFSALGSRLLPICHSSLGTENSQDPIPHVHETKADFPRNGRSSIDWTTSALLFALWAALMYYVFKLAPDQTPSTDLYFLKKLLNLKGNDGFQMNEVLVSLWYIMGLWPLVYSMLLLPSGRSSRSKIPVWPFLALSCFGGAYALLPYFILWRPPPPVVDESELWRWPLNFLESKITAWVLIGVGFGVITYAALANGNVWKEFYQYFRESKFIHIMSIDFSLLSTFAPFWVYNDMTTRKWYDRGSWLLPVVLIPFLGPALYLVLRPPLSVGAQSVDNESR